MEPVYRAGSRLANHRDTLNHRWSRALVNFAVKNGFGTIQMEDLSGIKEDTGFPKRLRHWTYYDLQQKITYKAAEKGITVMKVNRSIPPSAVPNADTLTAETGRCKSGSAASHVGLR